MCNLPKPCVPAAVAEAPKADADKKSSPRETQVHGVVVDEAGRPVAGAEVRANAFSVERGPRGHGRGRVVHDHDPRQAGRRHVSARPVRRRSIGSGVFQYDYNLTDAAARAPARIVVKPGREVVVHVTNAEQGSRARRSGRGGREAARCSTMRRLDATARPGCLSRPMPRSSGSTHSSRARDSTTPNTARLTNVGRSQGGAPATSLPGSVDLTLDGVRTARIKAVDGGGKPLSGVGFYVWLIHKEGRRSQVNVSSRIFTGTTGPDGIATFDWLPPSKDVLQFWPVGEGYARRRVTVEDGQTGPVTAKLIRTETIRGRVVRPDGSPASGIEVHAYGSGKGIEHGQDRTRTAADGTYELTISPGEAYAVYVDDKDWAAPSRLDVVVREGKPVEGVDFKLTRGTILRGTGHGRTGQPARAQAVHPARRDRRLGTGRVPGEGRYLRSRGPAAIRRDDRLRGSLFDPGRSRHLHPDGPAQNGE